MLTNDQMKLLRRLDEQVQNCTRCELYKNGRAKPYWSPASKFGMIPEAPGGNEVLENTPLCGTTGMKFWEVLKEFKLHKLEFFIVNSVNCRPMDGNKNGKPTLSQMKLCSNWVRKYIRIIQPKKVLVMGRYAIDSLNLLLTGRQIEIGSVVEASGMKEIIEDFYGMPLEVYFSVHPSWALIYNKDQGLEKLKESIKAFISDEDQSIFEGSEIHRCFLGDPPGQNTGL